MVRRHGTPDRPGVQVEIRERPYRQHHGRPVVEVTVWRSLEDCRTLLFEEVDPARRLLAPAGTLLGGVPRAAVAALTDAGYALDT